MILQQHGLVIIQRGRHAGCKAIIIGADSENNRVTVAGVIRTPKKVKEDASEFIKKKNTKMLIFIKNINMKHVIFTRYRANIGLSTILENMDLNSVINRTDAKTKIVQNFKDAFDNGRAKWLFAKLKF